MFALVLYWSWTMGAPVKEIAADAFYIGSPRNTDEIVTATSNSITSTGFDSDITA